jgi:AcrR family transcriptional regulator
MADKGVEGVAISEITDAADLGFGSFYNYFPSKEAIYEALIDEVVGQFAIALDRLGEQVRDPAEKVAASTRYTLLRGRQDPLWGRFVVRTGFSSDAITRGLGRYLLQDLSNGVQSKRFKAADFTMTFVSVGSIILGALAVEVDALRLTQKGQEAAVQDTQGLPERIATILLGLLGLAPQEAHKVARLPLPSIELPPNPFAE